MSFFRNLIGGNDLPPPTRQPVVPPQHDIRRTASFFQELRVYPSYFCGRQDIEKGDKILLPASALNQLYNFMSRSNRNPMIFCIKNNIEGKLTFCGVLQFVAEEGNCYIPNWMFKMLKFVEPGSYCTVSLVPDLKKSTGHNFVKLQPHLTKFIELPNPKAILEIQLRNFTCLHVGDTIRIKTYDGEYDIDILEIRPKNDYDAICVIDADVEVDFAPPHDYEEPNLNKKHSTVTYESGEGGQTDNKKKLDVFSGKATRIDEKSDKTGPNSRKPSSQMAEVETEYDPRKHRIVRGVRKATHDFTGNATSIGDVVGLKKR